MHGVFTHTYTCIKMYVYNTQECMHTHVHKHALAGTCILYVYIPWFYLSVHIYMHMYMYIHGTYMYKGIELCALCSFSPHVTQCGGITVEKRSHS